jgi:hypothetical protein
MTGFKENGVNYPYFIATRSGNIQIGNNANALALLPFNQDLTDNGNDFNTTNFTFTAPIKGLYQFNVGLSIINNDIAGSDEANDSHTWGFRKNDGLSGAISYELADNWGNRTNNASELSRGFSISVFMSANNTMAVYYAGKTDIEIFMSSSIFSGHLVKEFS